MPTINRWRGDAQPRQQVDRITITDPEVGDEFRITCNRKDLYATAEALDAESSFQDMAANLYVAFQSQFGSSQTIAEFAEIEAAFEYPLDANGEQDPTQPPIALLLYGPSDGKPFTVTVGSSDVGDLGISIEEIEQGVAAVNEQQTITLEPTVSGGTFTLTYDGQTTANIAWNANAAAVTSALEALSNIGVGDVSVSGTGPWIVTFQGTFAGADVDLMTADGALLTGPSHTISVSTLTQGYAGLNEQQVINIGNPTSGTFTLTFAGQTTAAINYNATAAQVETALEALSNIAPGDVDVTEIANQNGRRLRVIFKGTYRNTNVPLMTGSGASLDGWSRVQVTTTTQGRPAADPRLSIDFDNANVSGGNIWALRIYDYVSGDEADFEVALISGQSATGFPANGPVTAGNVYDEDFAFVRNIGIGHVRFVSSEVGSTQYTIVFELCGDYAQREVYTTVADAVENNGLYVDVVAEEDEPDGSAWDHADPTVVVIQGSATGVNEVQKVALRNGPTGGTFTLTFQGQTTAGIAYNAAASAVQTALEALSNIGVGEATVTGAAGGPWTVTFSGALASLDLQEMTGSETNLTGNSIAVATTQEATSYTNERQQVTIVGEPAGGTFTLSWGGFTTAGIAYNAAAEAVEAAIEAAFSIGVTVTGEAGGGPWTVEFSGSTVLGANQAQMTGSGASLSGSAPDIATTREAVQPGDEKQLVTLLGGPASGTFTLSYSGQTTSAIAYNASAAVVRNALIALSNIGVSDVLVSGEAGGPWTVTFQGSLGGQDVVMMTGDGSGLSPGAGTQTITLASVETPTGPEWINEPENWSLGTLLADGEWGVFEDSDRDALYGLDQMSTVSPAKLIFKGSYTGQIGLPDDNGSYIEYRPKKLRIGTAADAQAMTIEIGEGLGEGPSRLRLDTGDCQTTIEAHSLASPENGEPVALDWVGTHASNIVRLYKCQARLAGLEGELATIATLVIAYVDSLESDVNLVMGDGLTLGAVKILGGSTTCRSALAGATEQLGGNFYLEGAASASDLSVRGGIFFYSASGTLGGNPVISGGGQLDFSLDQRTKTITNPINIYGDTADINDPNKVANGGGTLILDYHETSRAPNLGRNYRISRAAVA
jgi:hypothetical protein